MRNILTAWALCAVALSAVAQCVADAHPPAAQHGQGSGWINTASAGTVEAGPGQAARGPLMNVAARTEPGMQVAEADAVRHKQDGGPEREHRRRTGPAMLIAAVAVMSAIALRRIGATSP